MARPKPSLLDGNQVLQHAFDDETSSLRTNATTIINGDTFAIELDAADGDNVAISDGTNTAQVTSNKELKVKDFESLAKLASIDSRLSLELNVKDTSLLNLVTLLKNDLENNTFKTQDVSVLAKLTDIENKLLTELSVKDQSVIDKLTSLENTISNLDITVTDQDVVNKLTDIETILTNDEFKVKDQSVIDQLISLENTLNSLDITVNDQAVVDELVTIQNLLTSTEFIVKDESIVNKLTDLQAAILAAELKVKDDSVVQQLISLQNALSSLNITVTDQAVIDELETLKTTQFSVKDSDVKTELQNINSKLTNLNSKTPTILNYTIPTANTENLINLPIGCKKYNLKTRGYSANLKLAFNQNESNTNYITIPRGCSYSEDSLELTTAYNTLYVQTNKDNVVIECIIWN
jgi:hypothetical protein